MRLSSYHPLVNVLFFGGVIVMAVAFTHPLFVCCGMVCALIYMLKLRGWRGLRYVAGAVAVGVCWAAGFTVTMHFGTTRLSGTIAGNPITLEALVCGVVQGVQLTTLLMWLNCLTAVFTADKVGYLLGRVVPRLSMAFALVLRAAPVINERRRTVARAVAGVGGNAGRGRLMARFRLAGRRAGAVWSWALDRSFAVQASLSSRGAQLKGRTAFSLYRFDMRDRSLVIMLVLLATLTGVGAALDQATMAFAPELVVQPVSPATLGFLVAYAAFCLLPLGLQALGEWCFSRSTQQVRADDERLD